MGISCRLHKHFRQVTGLHFILLPIAIICLFIKTSSADESPSPFKYQFASGHDSTQFPFDLYSNLIFIKTQVNDSGPLWFILDSGMEGTAINMSKARELGLSLSGERKEEAPGGSIDMANIMGVSIKMPGLEVTNMTVMAIPLDPLEPILGHKIDGILGHDFFQSFVIDIDYAAGMLTFCDPAKYNYYGAGTTIPVTIENDQPFVFAGLVTHDLGPVRAKLKLDTGSADLLGLNGSFVMAEKLIGPSQKIIPAPGAALGGETKNYITRLFSLIIGDLEIDNPVIGYSEDTTRIGDAGTIGGEFFRRFNVIFDYSRKSIILEKNKFFNDPPEYDMSGMFIVADGPDFMTIKVTYIADGSPAEQAGIKNGDVISKIDDKIAGNYSLDEIRKMFKIDGHEYKLAVNHGGILIETSIKLRRLI